MNDYSTEDDNKDSSHEISQNSNHRNGSSEVRTIASDETAELRPTASIKSPKCGGLSSKAHHESPHEVVDDPNRSARNKLILASIFCCLFMIGEVIGGYFAHSLAIMTDAAHLLSDLASFLISIFALWVATKEPTSRLSFGFHRAEILGALVSVLLIWVLTGVLVYEAVDRIQNPTDVDGKLMFIVAAAGLGVNIIMGVILFQADVGHSHGLGGHGHSHGGGGHDHGHGSGASHEEEGHAHADDAVGDEGALLAKPKKEENINVRAAFVHVLGDGIQSVGVMIAAGLIWHDPSYKVCDPICTFLFSLLVLTTTVRLVKQSAMVLMEGSPDGIDPVEVQATLEAVEGVTEVHDLHVWSLSVGKPSLSVHLLCTNNSHAVLKKANDELVRKYNIHHTTIQVEKEHDQIHCNPYERERRATSPQRSQSPLSPLRSSPEASDDAGDADAKAKKLKKERSKTTNSNTAESQDLETGSSYNGHPVVSSETSLNAPTVEKSEKPKRKKGGHGHSHGGGGGHGHSHGGGHGHSHGNGDHSH